jgi:hypothetical protein
VCDILDPCCPCLLLPVTRGRMAQETVTDLLYVSWSGHYLTCFFCCLVIYLHVLVTSCKNKAVCLAPQRVLLCCGWTIKRFAAQAACTCPPRQQALRQAVWASQASLCRLCSEGRSSSGSTYDESPSGSSSGLLPIGCSRVVVRAGGCEAGKADASPSSVERSNYYTTRSMLYS